jgi:hypothetical protein
MSKFLTELEIKNITDKLWKLTTPLVYKSDLLDRTICVPSGFVTDLASVPRVPIVYYFWGGRCHREAVIHDYLYRTDSAPVVSCSLANRVFLEAAKTRGKAFLVRVPMFVGVVLGGWCSFHRKKVTDWV